MSEELRWRWRERGRRRKIDTMKIAGTELGKNWPEVERGGGFWVLGGVGVGDERPSRAPTHRPKEKVGETPPSAREKPHDGGEAG